MRLKISRSKNSASLYVIKSTYINGVHSTKIVEKLGTVADLEKKLNGKDPIEWAKEYIDELTKQEKEQSREVMIKYSPVHMIPKGEQRSFNGGYLFLQRIYHELRINKICRSISDKYKFSFDLNGILSRLIYGRIIFPASKLATCHLSERFIEQPNFDIQHIYRALEIISKESDFIQAELYKNSLKVSKRKTGILYYDCTNYFFEIEQEDGLKQYGFSKEHRPNPIVQMGLFMDADGIPLAFSITNGNMNEQVTLKPLEEKILSDFDLSKFVVCTDAGLASKADRIFNDKASRAFITTQSIKKLKKYLKEWALDSKGWLISGDSKTKTYDLSIFDDLDPNKNNNADDIHSPDDVGKANPVVGDSRKTLNSEDYNDKIFYKERWMNEDGLEQKLIVTFSLKYRDYQRKIRHSQIERAGKLIEKNPGKLKKVNQNDYKRFITKTNFTPEGEVAENVRLSIDAELIAQEESFDGFYGVCTNLEDKAEEIIKVNQRRWEIEECFRIMKSEFKARPVYLSRDDRINAHFMTCFIALIIYRLLEKKLGDKFTCHEIIDGLRSMNFLEIRGEGYIPTYIRTDLTDALHDAFGFRTDYQIVTSKQMKNIFKTTKK